MINVTLIKYHPGMIDDDLMRALYQRMVDDGTVDTVFHDGAIDNADDFMNMMKQPWNHLHLVMNNLECVGILWLNRIERTSAYVHFCGFSSS